MDQIKGRNNNFGFLRLLLATLVIVSHSPQILDGNKSREILTRFFGTLSSGELAVYGFFIISGYLVTKSFLQSSSLTFYLEKRILRIFPGFLASFWICVLLIAPFVSAPGTVLSAKVLIRQLPNSLTLTPPNVAGVFPGIPRGELNGSMWTIAYEFACYIAAMLAGMVGLYSRRLRAFILIAVSILLFATAFDAIHAFHFLSPTTYVFLVLSAQFGAVFGVGALYYLYRDKVRLTSRGALVSALLLFCLLFSMRWAEMAVAVFGGYLIFYIAFELPELRISKLINKVDLSYGVYLYAWPIASVIAWNFRSINAWLLSAITLACSVPLAYLSWVFVEKPSLGLLREEKAVRMPVYLDAPTHKVP